MEILTILILILGFGLIFILREYRIKRLFYALVRVLTEKFFDQKTTSLLRQYREAQYYYGNSVTLYATPFFSNWDPDGTKNRMYAAKERCVELRQNCEKVGAWKVQLRAFGFIYYGSGGGSELLLF